MYTTGKSMYTVQENVHCKGNVYCTGKSMRKYSMQATGQNVFLLFSVFFLFFLFP